MLITPTTDLTQFVGVRVKITRTVRETRFTYHGVFEDLWHSADLPGPVGTEPHCGGMLRVEPCGDSRGGMTDFDLPYGDATIELA